MPADDTRSFAMYLPQASLPLTAHHTRMARPRPRRRPLGAPAHLASGAR